AVVRSADESAGALRYYGNFLFYSGALRRVAQSHEPAERYSSIRRFLRLDDAPLYLAPTAQPSRAVAGDYWAGSSAKKDSGGFVLTPWSSISKRLQTRPSNRQSNCFAAP